MCVNEDKILRMKDLIKALTEADIAYYRDDDPVMSDREYDQLTDELLKLEAETGLVISGSPTQKASGEVLEELTSVRHAGFTIRTVRITIKSALSSRSFPLAMMQYAVSLITSSGGILRSRLKAGTNLKVLPSSRSPKWSLRPMSLSASAGSWRKTVF